MRTVIVDTIPEWRYQAEVIARLHKMEKIEGLPFTCAGDMNRGKRSKRAQMEAKVTGMTAGEADVRIYLTGGRLFMIELKTPNGRRSKEQKERHALFVKLGFEIVTAAAKTPEELADVVEALVRERLAA
jgi:hypothetical protein